MGTYVRDNKAEESRARQVSEMVNNMSFDYEAFCKAMENEHRTLQQNFTRLCMTWLETCAKDGYRTDGRNEDSHRVAKVMVDALNTNEKEQYLSFI